MWGGEGNRLSGGLFLFVMPNIGSLARLQAMQEIRGALRMRGGGDDKALIVLQHCQRKVGMSPTGFACRGRLRAVRMRTALSRPRQAKNFPDGRPLVPPRR